MPKKTPNLPDVSRKNLWTLRLMIIIGCLTMIIFYTWLLRPEHHGQTVLYYLLISVMFFGGLKVLAEWYHYFSLKIPPTPKETSKFSVDVLTTYCPGEPIEMIEETLRAIKAIEYPHESYLCDEADDAYLRQLCQKLGIHHITRDNRKDAKAGNINNALKQAAGEICVILDPDHVPQPDFLDPILPHFADPKVGFVQIVQAYKNIRESIVSRGAAQQTFQFYGPMMMSMNSYGTVQAIGANCTFRRAALDSIGGHAPGLAEDMHTAMHLHARGWKSVYVPKVLARGLVPSTLSAYYKQQLKWSRGVFELLFTTFVGLFGKFTWRQKIHYGTAPLHYFSGVVYFINFLIPIFSLLFAVIPLKVDLMRFVLVGAPFFLNALLIRHYVQRWVMEETERGFHLIGGILQIGTWWVHALGFVYAVMRKKVPYLPTPKDDEEGNNLLLNLPNIIIAAGSVFAIAYGISIDYNPYTFIMAGLAATNCLFMGFMVMAGQHRKFSRLKTKYQTQRYTRGQVQRFRYLVWRVKHSFYFVLRRVALPLCLAFTLFSAYNLSYDKDPGDTEKIMKQGAFYTGIYSPSSVDGLTLPTDFQREEERFQAPFNLVAQYIPWTDRYDEKLADSLLQFMSSSTAYPLITWEPWVSTFTKYTDNDELKNEKKGLSYVTSGYFDDYIVDFAQQLKALNKPVFLRFAHEPDNPMYPWSPSGGNSPGDFIAAWKHVHSLFQKAEAHNVLWVWNPWKAENMKDYFPGEKYVDWIGVTCLNYGAYNPDGKWYEFDEYYHPFATDSIFQKNIPVLLAEFGSLDAGGNRQVWLQNALHNINNNYPEIRGIVFFHSDQDENVPEYSEKKHPLNWKTDTPAALKTASFQKEMGMPESEQFLVFSSDEKLRQLTIGNTSDFFKNIRGVNYRKASNWFRNYYALTTREISKDFEKITALGANTVKYYGPGIYDKNVLKSAAKYGLKVQYSFWIPDDIDPLHDQKQLKELHRKIITTIEKHKDNPSISSWNIGNSALKNLHNRYYKPDVFLRQHAYLKWLKGLAEEIHKNDSRPLTVDVAADENLQPTLELLNSNVTHISAFGLIYDDEGHEPLEHELPHGYPLYISDIPANFILNSQVELPGCFISSLQDLGSRDYVSYTGLIDHKGKQKEDYIRLQKLWVHQQPTLPSHTLRIMKPSFPLTPDVKLSYSAVMKRGKQWVEVSEEDLQARFTWHLIRTDGYGNGVYTKKIGEGSILGLIPPNNYHHFELLLSVEFDDYVVQCKSTLHTPLSTSQ